MILEQRHDHRNSVRCEAGDFPIFCRSEIGQCSAYIATCDSISPADANVEPPGAGEDNEQKDKRVVLCRAAMGGLGDHGPQRNNARSLGARARTHARTHQPVVAADPSKATG